MLVGAADAARRAAAAIRVEEAAADLAEAALHVLVGAVVAIAAALGRVVEAALLGLGRDAAAAAARLGRGDLVLATDHLATKAADLLAQRKVDEVDVATAAGGLGHERRARGTVACRYDLEAGLEHDGAPAASGPLGILEVGNVGPGERAVVHAGQDGVVVAPGLEDRRVVDLGAAAGGTRGAGGGVVGEEVEHSGHSELLWLECRRGRQGVGWQVGRLVSDTEKRSICDFNFFHISSRHPVFSDPCVDRRHSSFILCPVDYFKGREMGEPNHQAAACLLGHDCCVWTVPRTIRQPF